ncbi:hypothetical protein D3C86_1825720 [compost metagenome]
MDSQAFPGSRWIKLRQILTRRFRYAGDPVRTSHHQSKDQIRRQRRPPADLFGNGPEIKIVNQGDAPFAAAGTSEGIGVEQHIDAELAAKCR